MYIILYNNDLLNAKHIKAIFLYHRTEGAMINDVTRDFYVSNGIMMSWKICFAGWLQKIPHY